MPSDSQQPTEPTEPTNEPAARASKRSARAAQVAAVQRARGNSTGPEQRRRAPQSLKPK